VYREDILLRTWVLLQTKQSLTLPDEIDTFVQDVYEERVPIPIFLEERMNVAVLAEGKSITHRQQANMAIIGFPDDGSWKEVKHEKADDDEPGLHPTLVAQTRIGEPSVVVIALFPEDMFALERMPDFAQAKAWFLRAVSLSRKDVVKKLQKLGVPEGWKKSPLLRNCFPLMLDAQGRWTEDAKVRLDDDFGLVYEPKEAE
jgi:CRISPR-associated endonuclease/helicase Cas3